MIFVDLSEGLGNQMFQYAFARKLQEEYGEMLFLDTESYRRNKGIRHFSLEKFKLNENVDYKDTLLMKLRDIYAKTYRRFVRSRGIDFYNPIEMRRYEKKGFYMFSDVFGFVPFDYVNYKKNKYVMGSWMNERYFAGIREQLIQDFTPKEILSEKNRNMIEQVSCEESVCIHIRLGDYLDPKWSYLNVCTENYYKKAVEEIKNRISNPVFYVFSNTSKDLKWIKNNYSFMVDYNFVDLSNSDYEDLEIMKHCKHYIISNSTYSWWAQYLCQNKNKLVIAPGIWQNGINGPEGYRKNGQTLGIYQDDWIIIEQ